MRTVMSGRARVAYSQIYVESGEDYAYLHECFAGQRNGLCGAAVPGKLFLITGLHTGDVGFAVEVHDGMPSVEYSAEEVVEVSYRPIGDAALVTLEGSGGPWPLELEPQVDYRVRYSAWNMDAGHQAGPPMADEPPVDRYLLQFWPARTAPDRVVKETGKEAAYSHKFARELPTPAQLAELKAEKARHADEQRLAEHAAAWGGALPSARIEGIRFARELSAVDRRLVDAFERTDPETLRAIARWVARRACVEAGFDRLERIAGILGRMDRGDELYDALNGPQPPVPPGTELRATLHLVSRPDRWNAQLDPFENASMVITAAYDEDPLWAAIGTTWLALGAFTDKTQLPTELRQVFLTNPGF